MRRLIVLRPEPGNAATCRRIEAAGGVAVALPLFAVRAVEWTPPDPAGFDALVVTSANAVRHAGPVLAGYACLPVVAVGAATARAARNAGLTVAATGTNDAKAAAALLAAIGAVRPLHLTGREHHAISGAETVVVYASDPVAIAGPVPDGTALLHSGRAAMRLAALVPPPRRAGVAIAAISRAVLAAAGDGWMTSVAAPMPTDAALIAAALSIDPPGGGGDKTA